MRLIFCAVANMVAAITGSDRRCKVRNTGVRRRSADGKTPVCRVHRPDLLDIVEAADFRAEQVDDHVTGIDQYPVRAGQALDPALAIASFLQRAKQVVRHGTDMPLRAAGRHDEAIGDRGFALEINEDDILSLVVIQTAKDEIPDCGDAAVDVLWGLGSRGGLLRT